MKWGGRNGDILPSVAPCFARSTMAAWRPALRGGRRFSRQGSSWAKGQAPAASEVIPRRPSSLHCSSTCEGSRALAERSAKGERRSPERHHAMGEARLYRFVDRHVVVSPNARCRPGGRRSAGASFLPTELHRGEGSCSHAGRDAPRRSSILPAGVVRSRRVTGLRQAKRFPEDLVSPGRFLQARRVTRSRRAGREGGAPASRPASRARRSRRRPTPR